MAKNLFLVGVHHTAESGQMLAGSKRHFILFLKQVLPLTSKHPLTSTRQNEKKGEGRRETKD